MILEALLFVLSGVVTTRALVAIGRVIDRARFDRSLRADAARLPLYVEPGEWSDSAGGHTEKVVESSLRH
jgi:hypothetical protein